MPLEFGCLTGLGIDAFIQDVRGETYLALRVGESSVLLTECEAEALIAAIEKLAIFATALCSARDHIGKFSSSGKSREPGEGNS